MFKRLEQLLESDNILATEQFGFRKGVHIENAIFTLTNNILIAVNNSREGVSFAIYPRHMTMLTTLFF